MLFCLFSEDDTGTNVPPPVSIYNNEELLTQSSEPTNSSETNPLVHFLDNDHFLDNGPESGFAGVESEPSESIVDKVESDDQQLDITSRTRSKNKLISKSAAGKILKTKTRLHKNSQELGTSSHNRKNNTTESTENSLKAEPTDDAKSANSKLKCFILVPTNQVGEGDLQQIKREKETVKKKNYVCTDCDRICTSRGHLKQHSLIHTGERPFVCIHCGKGFTNRSNLDRHVKMHTGIKPHLCDLCGKGFIQKTSLQEHMLIHLKKKSHVCNLCERSYNRRTNLKQHVIRCHQNSGDETKDDSKDGSGDNHCSKRPYLCDTCGKGFVSVVTLKLHSKLHTGEKPFSCKVCDKAFVAKNQLEQHSRIHTGEKPYVCQMCAKSFIYKDCLTQHVRTHTGEKPYECNLCGKKYTQSHHLKGHMLTHTGEKPYVCSMCEKAYRNRADLRFHSLRVHQVDLSKCKSSNNSVQIKHSSD